MCMFSCMLCMLYGLPVFLNIGSVPIDCKSHLMFMCQLSEWMFSRCVALQCLLSNHPYACVFSFLMVTVTCCICLVKKCRETSSRKGVRKLVALRRPSGRGIFQCRLCGKIRVRQCRKRAIGSKPVRKLCLNTLCLFLCSISPVKAMMDCSPKHSVRHARFWQAHVGEASHPGPAARSRASARRRREKSQPQSDALQQVFEMLLQALQPGQAQTLLKALQSTVLPKLRNQIQRNLANLL